MTGTIPHPRSGKPMALIKRWRPMDIDNPPLECGVYAIKNHKQWMYIGRSVSIGTRIKMPYHPVRIMRDTESLSLSYWWHPVEKSILARTELFLIGKHCPEWNGGTHFEASHYPPYPSCRVLLPLTEQEQKAMEKRVHDALYAGACMLFGGA